MAMNRSIDATVVGVFTNAQAAGYAVRELKTAGFSDRDIGIAGISSNDYELDASAGDVDDSYAAEGAATGVAAGAGVGALWGLGILAGALPAIGPAIAGGTLAAILSSAAAGAATAGLAGALIGMGMSREEAEYYEGELRSGRTVITVHTRGRAAEASQILQRFGGYDIKTRDSMSHQTMDVPVRREEILDDDDVVAEAMNPAPSQQSPRRSDTPPLPPM